MQQEFVYKIVPNALWQDALRGGVFEGSNDDRRDGYIHLSAAEQVAGTLQRHYSGQSDLLLITFDVAELGPMLKFEASRGGALFPHFYGPISTSAARRVQALPTDARGNSVLEADWLTC